MLESIYSLSNTDPVSLLGVENSHIKMLAASFPQAKIIARGDEIKIRGTEKEIVDITKILQSLVINIKKFGFLNEDHVSHSIDMVLGAPHVRAEEKEKMEEESDEDVILFGANGQKIRPKTEGQFKLLNATMKSDLVFALGPAGTGKTYMAVAAAVRALKRKEVKKIIITRPAVEAGENLGFLPGDLQEKINPYIRPIFDALEDMIPVEKLKFYQANNIIEIAPLAYMRGRTLSQAFILLDEAQNSTPMQMKMFLTRLGMYSRAIITGDMSQVDLPKNQESGLKDAVEKLKDIPEIGFVHLTIADVTRHQLVKKIISAYGKY